VDLLPIFIFWFSAFALFFTFAGYALIIAFATRKKTVRRSAFPSLTVAIVVVAHNEKERIIQRIENLLSCDYPPELFEIVVVSDGSTDGTPDAVRSLNHSQVRVIELLKRGGKSTGLNAGVKTINSEVVVFTDARQKFKADTIRRLVTRFAEPEIGAVSGELEIASSANGVGSGVDAYWKLERFLRARESLLDSCIGCTGAVYAIRRSLYRDIPGDTVLDDVVIPMNIALAGFRVVHESSAIAFDPQPLDPIAEKRRKRRTLAGNFQMLFRHPEWMTPWRNRLWWQLISHKYLRLAGPFLLCVALMSSASLSYNAFYKAAFFVQVAFYIFAAIGRIFRVRSKLFTLPAGFVFLNLSVLNAFWHYLSQRDLARWQTKL
jgi:cellulose synthase/poly-beta-1,6-N-acetylglucosamine synthase-like glycosyltransferase